MVKNLACVLYGEKDLRMEDRDVPVPKEGQLLIKVHTVGICGTDIHFWTKGRIGSFVVDKPMVMCHECSGTVEEVGPNVTDFKIGDRVAVEPGVPCRKCIYCKRGRYNLCPDQKFFALPPNDGALRQFATIDADYCFKVPDSMSFEEATLIEPISVAIHSCRKAQIGIGSSILILGAGPVGLTALIVAKAIGATRALVTDVVDHRLAVAKELGADETLNVKDLSTAEAANKIFEKLGGHPDSAIECCGFQSSIELAIKAIRDGGRVVLVALGSEHVQIPVTDVVAREIDLCGVIKYADTWPAAIELIRSGKLKLDKLSRAHYKLEQAIEAFEHSKKGEVIKVFVHCNDA